ncbi:hypothetical protein [Herbaspirillum seropedicae]|uniref:hypothetical protein n=1 Tax=Herbaspirillum seropedicae TaxID=964 RepID=UPI000847F436|nr:hypothetical protein [Herbaspirillum seropedicae]AON52600.1 hypothetical protein Hsc_0287 [Herbaspirillum seropedicae]
MIAEQRLKFVSPQVQAYCEALSSLPAAEPALLIGTGALADAIAAWALAAAMPLHVQAVLPEAGQLANYRVIIFTEQDGEGLAQMLLACLDLNDVRIIAPITARHFSRMPLFVVSIPKAGTHLVYELAQALGYAPGVEMPDFPRPQTWYCVEYSNSHTVAKDFFVDTVRRAPFGNRHHPAVRSPVLFAYRHPLDILVSEANYYHRDGKTAFSGYFHGLDFQQRVNRLMDDEWLLGSLRSRVGGFLPWLELPNVIPTSFEELVGEAGGGSQRAQHRLIWSVLLKLQVDGCVAELAGKVFNKESATFREGKIGAWRTQLTPPQLAQLQAGCADVIAAFGYSTERNAPLLPDQIVQYARRPLRLPSVDFESMPLTEVPGFMGCNLVRYAGRFFALPLSAGPLALESLTDAQRGRLPVADSLDELKAILLIGHKAYKRQYLSLHAAGEALADGAEPLAFWKDSAVPHVFGYYQGYNLVAWEGRYLALRQAIGPVDLSRDLAVLMAAHPGGDILAASDLDELIMHLDGVSAAMRVGIEAAQREGGLSERLRGLEADAATMQQEHARIQAESAQRESILGEQLQALEARTRAMQQEHAQAQVRQQVESAQREATFGERLQALEDRARAMQQEHAQAQVRQQVESAQREAMFGERLQALEDRARAIQEEHVQTQARQMAESAQREAMFGERLRSLETAAVILQQEQARVQTEFAQREALIKGGLEALEAGDMAMQHAHARMHAESVQRQAALSERLNALESLAIVRLGRLIKRLFRRG